MDLSTAKAICGLASALSSFASCAYWYRSSKAEVPLSTITPGTIDEMGIEFEGREIAVFSTSRLQCTLGAKGAMAAAVAGFFQLVVLTIDALA